MRSFQFLAFILPLCERDGGQILVDLQGRSNSDYLELYKNAIKSVVKNPIPKSGRVKGTGPEALEPWALAWGYGEAGMRGRASSLLSWQRQPLAPGARAPPPPGPALKSQPLTSPLRL